MTSSPEKPHRVKPELIQDQIVHIVKQSLQPYPYPEHLRNAAQMTLFWHMDKYRAQNESLALRVGNTALRVIRFLPVTKPGIPNEYTVPLYSDEVIVFSESL